MTTIAQTRKYYADYDWSAGGKEWSHYWGSNDLMWRTTIYPRIRRFLPVETILEIGAGYGRVSNLLEPHASRRLILTDYLCKCVEACSDRFKNNPRVSCQHSDGLTLKNVEDGSVDLVVSFYSLVDSDVEVIESYVAEIRRILAPNGAAFIHHSNAGAYYDIDRVKRDRRMQILAAYRDTSLSAAVMRQISGRQGLICISQECVNWDIRQIFSDCFSVIVHPDSHWRDEPIVYAKVDLVREMELAQKSIAGQILRDVPTGPGG